MRVRRLRKFRKPRTGELVSFETRQYYITDDGQVYDGTRKRFLNQCENHYGYLALNLRDNEGARHTNIGVHDLVASVFIRLLEKGVHVHHVNHIRSDNRVENLQIIESGEHSRRHMIENWRNGTMDGVSEKMKKAWKNGKYDGVSAKSREKVAAKLRNVGNSYRPAKQIVQLAKDGQVIKVWPSTMECHRNGYNFSNVARCCRGERHFYKNYRWQWYEDYLAQHDTETVSTAPVQLEFNFL